MLIESLNANMSLNKKKWLCIYMYIVYLYGMFCMYQMIPLRKKILCYELLGVFDSFIKSL